MLRRPLSVAAVALATLGACGRLGAATEDGPTEGGAAKVERVVDGDTVRVRFPGQPATESVRLIGVDTPETHGPGGLRECFGREASDHTASLLPPGTAVRLVRDAEARDRYGRLLAYIYRSRDDLFVNLELARKGFAVALTIPPNVAHTDAFVTAAAAAREGHLGLWGRCGGADTPV